tara:strand:- start:350 stop:1324 length:975 start_codon:yes stop_codon:yes gene_type:complete
MAYIGREPQIGNYQICDAISVVNGQAAYTMQVSSVNVIPESVNHMIVSLNGVIQKPGSSYTISSSTITFSSNLATGDSIDFIYLLGNVLDLGTPSDSTVTSGKLSGNLVTPGTLDVNGQELILDADADTSITADTDDQIDIKIAGADDFQFTANTFTAQSGSSVVVPDGGLTFGSTAISSTAAELNYNDLATLGTTAASKVFTADANGLTKVSGAVLNTEDTLTDQSTIAWDVVASPVAKVTLAGNRTIAAPSGTTPAAGQFVSLLIIQDGTGSRTITWNAVYEFASDTAPTLTTTANLGDIFIFRYNGSKWLEVGRNLALTLS